jgi:hypothetical protein
MAESATPPVVPQAVAARSPLFRAFFSDFMRNRIGPGTFTVIFGAVVDDPGAPFANILQEEAQVTMSWAQLKTITTFFSEIVEIIESETGQIALPAQITEETQTRKESVRRNFRFLRINKP